MGFSIFWSLAWSGLRFSGLVLPLVPGRGFVLVFVGVSLAYCSVWVSQSSEMLEVLVFVGFVCWSVCLCSGMVLELGWSLFVFLVCMAIVEVLCSVLVMELG